MATGTIVLMAAIILLKLAITIGIGVVMFYLGIGGLMVAAMSGDDPNMNDRVRVLLTLGLFLTLLLVELLLLYGLIMMWIKVPIIF